MNKPSNIALGAFVLITGVVGVYVFQNGETARQHQNIAPQMTIQSQKADTSLDDKGSITYQEAHQIWEGKNTDWRVYSNEEFGIQISLPPTTYLMENISQDTLSLTGYNRKDINPNVLSGYVAIEIEVRKAAYQRYYDICLDSSLGMHRKQAQLLTLDGYTGSLTSFVSSGDGLSSSLYRKFLCLRSDRQMIGIYLRQVDKDQKVITEILNSVKMEKR